MREQKHPVDEVESDRRLSIDERERRRQAWLDRHKPTPAVRCDQAWKPIPLTMK